jgi:hypothetical protein
VPAATDDSQGTETDGDRNPDRPSTSVVLTSDTHLDRKNMGRAQRRQDYLDAFEQVTTHAVDVDADVLVHLGNLFWSKSPARTSWRRPRPDYGSSRRPTSRSS